MRINVLSHGNDGCFSYTQDREITGIAKKSLSTRHKVTQTSPAYLNPRNHFLRNAVPVYAYFTNMRMLYIDLLYIFLLKCFTFISFVDMNIIKYEHDTVTMSETLQGF
jgi:hypothetical protein